ncbi:hypothetical protein [Spongiactinospora sp. TRM90649]|uniref:hypothetical protein n=1 Tax=Spongiactinospora sp. TRM90649 TaxID=3031114 RepID=UPI0023F7CCEA|nr:hypothetical protein [Spongiactinospora sp. TRM90649]MDF5751418.1 hypothetical protein [Spongiactinospora sp. TRM90649]
MNGEVRLEGRLPDLIGQARERLQPWATTRHVRALDDRLHALAIAPRRPGPA